MKVALSLTYGNFKYCNALNYIRCVERHDYARPVNICSVRFRLLVLVDGIPMTISAL
jgi:hypothetical protein